MKNIEDINKESVKKILTTKGRFPNFFAGDTLKVGVRIVEGKRERIQYFEGVCIAKKIAILIHLLRCAKFHLVKVSKELLLYIVPSLDQSKL